MVLYTPLGGSWLNTAESIQRILCRRALEGHYPKKPEEIIEWLEGDVAVVTPFEWGGRACIDEPGAAERGGDCSVRQWSLHAAHMEKW